ncbi:MAG: transglycosylase SLT domain-containing protein [Deferribacterales bacterium]
MKKLFCLAVLMLFASFAFAEGFDDFKESMDSGFSDEKKSFDTYKKELEREFAEYRRIADEEYAAYKNEILSQWKTAEMSTPVKWVEYTDGLKKKKVVDFENGIYRLEVIGKDYTQAEKELDALMRDMLGVDKATAFQRDTPARKTDEKAREKLKNIAVGTVGNESVIGSAVIGKENPAKKDIDLAAEKLKENAEVKTEPSKTGETVFVMQGKLPPETYRNKAEQLNPSVQKYSREFKIQPSLIFSVIQTESAFNPVAQSHIPAYGLMQIVPTSAGRDVAQLLMGKSLILTPSYLFNTDNNIRAGTAYLHILYYRYLKAVSHPESRFYCSVAAYNTGAGNVASAFNGRGAGKNRYNVTAAAGIINGMAPSAVYDYLRSSLEYDEARRYIVKVMGTLPSYKYFDQP